MFKHAWVAFQAIALGATLTSTSVYGQQESTEIRFGSVAMDIPAEMHRRLSPMTKYLTEYLKQPVSLKLSPNMPAAINDVATGEVELAYLTPVAYLKAKSQGDVQIVVKTVTDHQSSFQLMLVTREDSAIKTVDDLAGKTFAFGDKAALLQRAVVVGAGIPLEKLGDHKFLGHYDNIARGVLNGDFDAGILKDTTAFKWQGKGLRIIHESDPLPPYNIAASKNVSPAVMVKLKKAFLALDINNPEHAIVIQALDKHYTGFAASSDADYEVVRKLIAPFNP